jgi:class 3 adenylate cyclase
MATPSNKVAPETGPTKGGKNKPAVVVEEKKELSTKEKTFEFMDGRTVMIVMLIATLYALFAMDIYFMLGPPIGADKAMYTITFICFILFSAEWMILTWCGPEYLWSFFFFLDALAAASLIPDVVELFAPAPESKGSVGGGTDSLTIARAGRAARAGTRAARIVRIFKLLSLIRKRKAQEKKLKEQREEELKKAAIDAAKGAGLIDFEEDLVVKPPSKIGSKLSDGITQKVIIIVAFMLISSTFIDLLVQPNFRGAFEIALKQMEAIQSAGTCKTAPYLCEETEPYLRCCSLARTSCLSSDPQSESWQAYREECLGSRDELVPFNELNTFKKLNDACGLEKYICGNCSTLCHYIESRYFGDLYEDIYGLGGTRIRRLKVHLSVIRDFEVSDLRTNPSERLVAATPEESEMLIENKEFVQQGALASLIQMLFIVVLLGVTSWLFGRDADSLIINPLERMANFVEKVSKNPLASVEMVSSATSEEDASETDFVEAALRKFCKLLQVAFGEAGAGVIAKNLKAGAEIDPMSEDNGIKMRAIFGFVEIRSFTDCTECLEEQVMIFVNTVAKYVHNSVTFYHGSPNKNIGDVFLLCWRLNDWDQEYDEESNGYVVADEALKSFIQIIHDTAACPALEQITDHPVLQKRMPGFRVKLGFGLHVGWAIEGAIGSTLKIDASYLSPNVNLASRLEAATKQYGVQILVSDEFWRNCSTKVQDLLRRVDRVTVKGSAVPMEFYTYDVAPKATHEPGVYTDDDDSFWIENAPRTTPLQRDQFAQGIQAYLDGDWMLARDSFDYSLSMDSDDAPAQTLLEYMNAYNFQAPPDWKGFRPLTSK